MTFAIFAALMVVLNRVRGGGFGAAYLPGHPRFYVAPVVGGLSWALLGVSWWAAGGAYLLWSLIPWGRWYTVDQAYNPVTRIPTWLERQITRLGWDQSSRFLMAQIVGLLPSALLLAAWAPLAALPVLLTYKLAWWLLPEETEGDRAIELAELGTGFLWAALIWSTT